MKHLRTDNGLEYLSEEFQSFCKDKGITRHRTVPANPQQNGVAERMNRTLLERVRCMLSNAKLPKSFWGEAVNTAWFLINKSPSSAIEMKTPDEIWYGRTSDYSKLKVFGCTAYAHIKQDKLEPRALRCIFVGYPKGVKRYRLWCLEPGHQKCVISRDVTFNETQMGYKHQGNSQDTDGNITDEVTPLEVELSDTGTDDRNTEQQATKAENEEIEQQEADHADNLRDYSLTRDRVRRTIHPPTRFGHADLVSYALVTTEALEYQEPRDYKEAITSSDSSKWILAMQEELQSLEKNCTWELVKKPKNQKLVSCKWIFKRKVEVGVTEQIRFKARLVARGFTQREGVDFNEVVHL